MCPAVKVPDSWTAGHITRQILEKVLLTLVSGQGWVRHGSTGEPGAPPASLGGLKGGSCTEDTGYTLSPAAPQHQTGGPLPTRTQEGKSQGGVCASV